MLKYLLVADIVRIITYFCVKILYIYDEFQTSTKMT